MPEKTSLSNFDIGDIVTLGSYEQDNISSNGKEDVEWIILDKNSDSILLISKYGLEVQQYHDDWEIITWEECALREWMNNTFLEEVFGEKEQKYIVPVTNNNPDNEEYGTLGGNDTLDRMFVLSYREAEEYFSDDSARRATITEYADAQFQNLKDTKTYYFWLRSSGDSGCRDVAVIDSNGKIDLDGRCITRYQIVRPAVWIDALCPVSGAVSGE